MKNQPLSSKCFIVTNSLMEVGVYTEIRLACKNMTIILWKDRDSVNGRNNPWYQLTGKNWLVYRKLELQSQTLNRLK